MKSRKPALVLVLAGLDTAPKPALRLCTYAQRRSDYLLPEGNFAGEGKALVNYMIFNIFPLHSPVEARAR
jgi:hypothetical protein